MTVVAITHPQSKLLNRKFPIFLKPLKAHIFKRSSNKCEIRFHSASIHQQSISRAYTTPASLWESNIQQLILTEPSAPVGELTACEEAEDSIQNSSCFHIIQIMQTPTPNNEGISKHDGQREFFPLNYSSSWKFRRWTGSEREPGNEKYIFRIINSKYISLPFIYIFPMFVVRLLCHVERHMSCQQRLTSPYALDAGKRAQ